MKVKLLAVLLALPLIASGAGAAGGAGTEAGAANTLQLAMSLYAGGISLGKVDMNATFTGSKYRVVSNLQTSGVVNVFWQSEIQATASGRFDGRALQPEMYDSYYTGHSGRHQQVALTFENGNPVRLYANPPYPVKGYEVKPEEKRGTFDPLSAIVAIVSGAGAGPCDKTVPIFDGRRRYSVVMSKVKDIDIKMDNGLYKGPGVQCEVVYKQISGYSQKLLRTSKLPPIYAWMAVIPAGAGRSYHIPLRVWAKTDYGTVAAVATALKAVAAHP